jgi:ferredoxin
MSSALSETAPQPPETNIGDDTGPKTISITLSGERHHVPYHGSETVLEACQRAGVKAPHSCQRGFCGSCRAVLKYGEVDPGNPHRRALSEADAANGRILTCQARPSSSMPFGITYDESDFRRRNADGDRTDAPIISASRVALVVSLLAAGAALVHVLKQFAI